MRNTKYEMRYIPFLLLLLLLAGCAPAEPATAVIDLDHLEPLSQPDVTEVTPLRVAVAAIISPKGTIDSYGSLLDYLEQELQRPVELVQRRTYMEVNDLIAQGEIDLAFVCTSAYVAGVRDFDMQLLVAPQVSGDTVYHSLLLVGANSPARAMRDLQGKVFAFTDPISHTGRNYPTYLVQQLGHTPDNFFARTFFTYSHDNAIYAVANGVADGAAVDSLIYEFALLRDPDLAHRIRVIHQSPPFGIPPVVVGPHVRPQLRAEMQAALMQMAENPEGQAALAAAGIDRFVLISDDQYDTVRAIEQIVGEK
jgi:phosphonate transport system substrate-binding protein